MVNISHLDNLKRFHKFFFPDKDRKQNKTKTYVGLFFFFKSFQTLFFGVFPFLLHLKATF